MLPDFVAMASRLIWWCKCGMLAVCLEAYTEAGSSKQSAATLSTPSVFKRLSAASTSAIKPADPGPSDPAYQAVALQCQKLDAEVQLWKVRAT